LKIVILFLRVVEGRIEVVIYYKVYVGLCIMDNDTEKNEL